MGIFDKFKKQQQAHDLSEEEQEQLTSMMNTPSSNDDATFDIVEYIKSISTLHEVNKLRNLLDMQEEVITGIHPVDKEKDNPAEYKEESSYSQPSFTIEEEERPVPEIKEEYSQDKEEGFQNLQDNESYESSNEDKHNFEVEEVDDYKTLEDNFEDKFEEVDSIEDEFSIQKELFLDKLKELFGEDNIFVNVQENSAIESLKDKKVLHIGLRQKYAFGLDSTTPQEENKWFITTIKQLDDLKNFKMLRSEEGIKDLVWDRGDFAILLSFRSTNLLNSVNEFDFEL